MSEHGSLSATTTDLAALELYATRGDPRAFEVLTVRYRGMVLATCYRMLRSMADAEDATQETFLKLAQNAREVRSNAAAWLHATAVRTSLDLLRRKGARERAVQTANEQARQQSRAALRSDQGDDRAWSEIEPIVDAALAKLTDADRSLIVARFLAGRSQVELAAEAGVNPGTLSRRLDAAIERLRDHLRAGGMTLAVGGVTTALLCAPASVKASPALAASLGKIGLSQIATPGSPATLPAASAKVPVLLSVVLMLICGGVGAWMYAGKLFTALPRPAPLAASLPSNAVYAGFDLPASPIQKIANLIDDSAANGGNGTIYFDGKKAIFNPRPGNEFRIVYDILRCDSPGPGAMLEMVCTEVQTPSAGYASAKVGDRLGGVWSVKDRLFRLYDDKSGRSLFAVRPHAGSKLAAMPLDRPDGNDPALAGMWVCLRPGAFLLDNEKIGISNQEPGAEIYKIITWEKTPQFTKVEAICSNLDAQSDRRAIGKRFKLLVCRNAEGDVIITHNTYDSGKNNEWPPGLDTDYLTADPPGSVAPIAGRRTLVFVKDKP